MEKFFIFHDVWGDIGEPEPTRFEYEIGEIISVNDYSNKYKCIKKEVIDGKLYQHFKQGKVTMTFDY